MATRFYTHSAYLNHMTPAGHPERPDRLRAIASALADEVFSELDRQEAPPCDETALLLAHPKDHVDRIRDAIPQDDILPVEADTWVSAGSWEAATRAVGASIAAVDDVFTGRADNVFVGCRPPGHHAEKAKAMGFCLFNNAAIAARYAQKVYGAERIAIVDWDVHHGNGTEAAFWTEPRALTISIHQDRCFPPTTGGIDARGEGPGFGTNINIPLPPGSGVGAYEATFDRVVIPALRAFKPDLIFVPSGFDAGAHDPLGRMMMHSEGYRSLTRKLMAAAEELCGGRLVMCHEGGYNAPTVPFYALAVIETLGGINSRTEDPFMPLFEHMGGQELQPHQEDVIARCAALLEALPA